MKIELNNIGILRHADIEIEGITVIAGYNDTGKSTVGRVLKPIFDSIYIDKDKLVEYKENRSQQINNMIIGEFRRSFPNHENSEFLNKFRYAGYEDRASVLIWFKNFVKEQELSSKGHLFNSTDKLNLLMKDLEDIDEQDYQSIFRDEFLTNLQFQFGSNLQNKFKELNDASSIQLSFSNNNKFLDLSVNGKTTTIKYDFNNLGSVTKIIPIMLTGDEKFSLFNGDGLNLSKETLDVLNEISEIINGKFNVVNGQIVFEKLGQPFDLNLSASGIKSFGLIYRMLQSGRLDSQTLLVIDEPELHMHPEWQIKMAEILVVISQKLYVPILLTTHSDLLLRSIAAFRKSYGLDKVNYYHARTCDSNINVAEIVEKKETDLDNILDAFVNPYFILDSLNKKKKQA